jgi:hypothetical protein
MTATAAATGDTGATKKRKADSVEGDSSTALPQQQQQQQQRPSKRAAGGSRSSELPVGAGAFFVAGGAVLPTKRAFSVSMDAGLQGRMERQQHAQQQLQQQKKQAAQVRAAKSDLPKRLTSAEDTAMPKQSLAKQGKAKVHTALLLLLQSPLLQLSLLTVPLLLLFVCCCYYTVCRASVAVMACVALCAFVTSLHTASYSICLHLVDDIVLY